MIDSYYIFGAFIAISFVIGLSMPYGKVNSISLTLMTGIIATSSILIYQDSKSSTVEKVFSAGEVVSVNQFSKLIGYASKVKTSLGEFELEGVLNPMVGQTIHIESRTDGSYFLCSPTQQECQRIKQSAQDVVKPLLVKLIEVK